MDVGPHGGFGGIISRSGWVGSGSGHGGPDGGGDEGGLALCLGGGSQPGSVVITYGKSISVQGCKVCRYKRPGIICKMGVSVGGKC